MCLYTCWNMCPTKIFLLFTLIYASLPNLWAQDSNRDGIQMWDAMLNDSQWSPLDAMLRTNKVNLVALETFGKLNQFGGNIIRLFLPLTEQIERGLLSLLRVIFPQIFNDLNPSDIAIKDSVTPSPDRSDLLIEELIAAFIKLAKKNSALLK